MYAVKDALNCMRIYRIYDLSYLYLSNVLATIWMAAYYSVRWLLR